MGTTYSKPAPVNEKSVTNSIQVKMDRTKASLLAKDQPSNIHTRELKPSHVLIAHSKVKNVD